MAESPDWYDDLGGMLRNVLEELKDAVDERDHGFRTFSVATIGLDGAPRSRIVVLRGVDAAVGEVRFHTDLRSRKIVELGVHEAVSLLFYDQDRKLQVRVRGTARILTLADDRPDDRAAAAFAGARPGSRVCYRVEPGPGTVIPEPDGYAHQDVADGLDGDIASDPGSDNFAAVLVACNEIEILYLASEGHRRARFRRKAGNAPYRGEWLTP
ncbi:pyridoxamine 5'-phosphate oxidase family protein [Fulvimarina sp. 2208YS6-2-32]|uniref:Pyridoxamine 5'-phosphate oxidase family protein n=2 Tax=Fulvimarina uroteuthidis TaxID=3098149 RepID=A0ABU5HXV7_9HYPH|nr:pyridoxamine 5'-phosphate oxidase family protein [Fulvimarina sp. 2208YS6-2-32]